MDLHEGALVGVREGHSGSPVGLVAYDEVELREAQLLGIHHGIYRLICGEHDGELAPVAIFQDPVRIRGGRHCQVVHRLSDIILPLLLGDVCIGADADRLDGTDGVGRPFPECLSDQGDRRC